MFSETRYALNGDLHVAYRTSREGPRDLVFVSNWITNREVFPELPSIQGWVGGDDSAVRIAIALASRFRSAPGARIVLSLLLIEGPRTPKALRQWLAYSQPRCFMSVAYLRSHSLDRWGMSPSGPTFSAWTAARNFLLEGGAMSTRSRVNPSSPCSGCR
jgi:hypothetical protein